MILKEEVLQIAPTEQNAWSREDFIVNLIKSDLIHSRVLYGFREMSFEPDSYFLPLYENILWTFGFWDSEQDELANWYFSRTKKVNKLKLSPLNKEVEILARQIFVELLAKSKIIQRKRKAISTKNSDDNNIPAD